MFGAIDWRVPPPAIQRPRRLPSSDIGLDGKQVHDQFVSICPRFESVGQHRNVPKSSRFLAIRTIHIAVRVSHIGWSLSKSLCLVVPALQVRAKLQLMPNGQAHKPTLDRSLLFVHLTPDLLGQNATCLFAIPHFHD